MKTLSTFASIFLLFAIFSLSAQEPVVGVDDPESLFTDDDPVLHRNK